ncbi:MAG: outer membrane lipoprotein-sorting protein [Bacteriovoracaceae bacterium]|nr:outer membrane lipoprotein-sorting protein [Bacteriovoracaceae bacterium]
MKNLKLVAISMTLVSSLSFAEAPSADEIMKKNFMTSKFTDSTADQSMRLINKDGKERVRESSGLTKLIPGTTDNQRLVTFNSPSDVKGTKNLLVEHSDKEDDIWIYLPALKKVRRLVASNKKDAFAGTDFSYGDIIGYKVEDWNHKFVKEDTVDGKACWLIESTAKDAAISSTYGVSKRVNCIEKDSSIAISGESYDLNGKLLKKYSSRDLKKLDEKANKWAPMIQEASNVETGHKTIIEFKNYKVNTGVSDAVFTTRSLEKR